MADVKQHVTEMSFAKPNAYDDENKPDFNSDFWNDLKNQDQMETDPVPDEDRKKYDEQLKHIENLYPEYHTEKVSISKLIPAKEEWNFFPNQDKTILADMMKNLVAYGQLSPALVWKQNDGTYMILGGHTRFKAFTTLHEYFTSEEGNNPDMAERFSSMDCYVYENDALDEVEARKIIIFDNIIRRDNTTAIKAKAVINMNRLELSSRTSRNPSEKRERVMTSIAKVLGTSEGSVKRLYQLRSLIEEFWPLVDSNGEEKITTQMARTFSQLPENLQRYIFNNHLYRNKLTGDKLKLLGNAANEEDINAVYSSPEKYVISGKLETIQQPPKDFETIMVVAGKQEAEFIKRELSRILEDPQISEETRNFMREIIQ